MSVLKRKITWRNRNIIWKLPNDPIWLIEEKFIKFIKNMILIKNYSKCYLLILGVTSNSNHNNREKVRTGWSRTLKIPQINEEGMNRYKPEHRKNLIEYQSTHYRARENALYLEIANELLQYFDLAISNKRQRLMQDINFGS